MKFPMIIIVTVNGAGEMFPWANGVKVNLQGDVTDLGNLISELNEVKKMVNADVNRAGLALRDVEVKIEFKIA